MEKAHSPSNPLARKLNQHASTKLLHQG